MRCPKCGLTAEPLPPTECNLHPAQVQEARRLLCEAVRDIETALRAVVQHDRCYGDATRGHPLARSVLHSANTSCDRAAAVLGIDLEPEVKP